jgi:prolyl-tRNA synthetase
MRWTQLLIHTQKEAPADAQIISHQLMVRAGLIRQLTAGVYEFLPLGLRSLQKAAAIVREEMNRIGGAEVLLPALQPVELWQKTGRDKSYGENLMKLKDRHGRMNVLGPTHEEVITELLSATVNSYKQLPLILYQIQTKFRDEFRPRSGLLRCREFLMKDAYSFHANAESLDVVYEQMYGAYERIFSRCGLPVVAVEAESGPIGGSQSHEFMVACDAGEDVLVRSDKGNYAANLESAKIGERPHSFDGAPAGALEKVHTPNLPGIDGVAQFMNVTPQNMLKTLVFRAVHRDKPAWIVGVVRGDHSVNEAKLARAAMSARGVQHIELADDPDVRRTWAIGFVGPDAALRNPDAFVVVDPDAAQPRAWVTGANEIDYHVKNFNWRRDCPQELADPQRLTVADIRSALPGDPSPSNDGGKLELSKGIEVGHVFKLGTKYSDALNANVLDEKGQQQSVIAGCYGIGIGRILVAAIETAHDKDGIIWPASIAPFALVVTPVKYEGAMKETADHIYAELNVAGVDTLLDDRDARPGFKFIDADLIGFPLRVTIGDRGLKEGKVEIKERRTGKVQAVPVAEVVERVRGLLRE